MRDTLQLSFAEQVALWVYLPLVNLLVPLVLLLFLPIFMLSEKRRKSLFARLGFQTIALPSHDRRPLWIHALSLGEALASISLVKELRKRVTDRSIVFSVSTLSARQIAQERLASHVDALCYFPLDLWWPARRIFAVLQPAMLVLNETDIWPGFQWRLRRNRVPAVLVNGRLSPESYRSCVRLGALFRPALNTFESIHPQSEGEAARYRDVGVLPEKIGQSGNLKFDVALTSMSEADLEKVREECRLTTEDKLWLAGSTHPGEEEIVRDVFLKLRESFPALKLISVPRHPARGKEVSELFSTTGLKVRLFTDRADEADADVLVVNVMGKLSSLYHVANVSFVGGSLVPKGGQNPIEPAAAGCPVLFGPDMRDFPDVSRVLIEARAARQVQSQAELLEQMQSLLENEEEALNMGESGQEVVRLHSGTTERIVSAITARLENLP